MRTYFLSFLVTGLLASTAHGTISAQDTTFNFISGTLAQVYVIPDCADSIRIMAIGGDGGNHMGSGAMISATFTTITPGDSLHVIVGQAGTNFAGGGGSAVIPKDSTSLSGGPNSDILLVAGGGGGLGINALTFSAQGAPGTITGGGQGASSAGAGGTGGTAMGMDGAAGTMSGAGVGGSGFGGGGGGGGSPSLPNSPGGIGYFNLVNGAAPIADGGVGFGQGGANGGVGTGGGGGYGGGGGGSFPAVVAGGGGGGGSFISSFGSPINSSVEHSNVNTSEGTAQNGSVTIITYCSSSMAEPQDIPTLSEWSIIILLLSVLNIGVVAIRRSNVLGLSRD